MKKLLEKQEIHTSGEIYSSRHFESFKVKSLNLSVKTRQKEKNKILKINGIQSQKMVVRKI